MAEPANETEADLIPLYGFLEGDTLGLLILGYRKDTIERLIQKLIQSSRSRVKPKDGGRFLYHGKELDPGLTLGSSGIEPLERFDVVFRDSSASSPSGGNP